jgi:hypothetical protein
VSTKVPLGSYKIKYAVGNQWYGERYLFGPETSYYMADKRFDFELRGDHIRGYSIDLLLQLNGNLQAKPISPKDF